MQQGRFRHDDMIHHPGAQPCGYVPTLVTRGVDQFCLAGMVWFWKALKPAVLIKMVHFIGHSSHSSTLNPVI
jgi:hypothetical protein